MTLNNQFASLTDGTNYLQVAILDAKTKQIQNQYHKRGIRPLSH